ncbi:LAMI_0D03114g1_1 [Lachancea mirantina]|uniref:LAMI_0D03114g1_1 n=1 Tax=Lachancea mirantina TaxID=1230905 RepID=A0A1G4JA83_9SACH|nr:LAMI_0D03114g1_1 [Lachancea mirantina]
MLRSSRVQILSGFQRCLSHRKTAFGAFSAVDFDVCDAQEDSELDSATGFKNQGFLVNRTDAGGVTVLDWKDLSNGERSSSSYRDSKGNPLQGENAKEARLQRETLIGKAPDAQIKLNPDVSKAINDHILSLHVPNNLRRMAAQYFIGLEQSKLHRATASPSEVDAHISTVFLQNYGAIYQSLQELKKRKGQLFNPKRVLDVGFGPATGMVALNDLMDESFRPEVKDAVILGHIDMQKRAKIILSRQVSELPSVAENRDDGVMEDSTPEDDIELENELVGEVMTKKIKIATRLSGRVPGLKQYDLIILTHQLLKSGHKFPLEIDENLDHYLSLLSPGGHLVLVERGNPLGFETIARARQIMLRPENYLQEGGKIPRPWGKNQTSASVLDDKSHTDASSVTNSAPTPEQCELEPEFMASLREVYKESPPFHLSVIAPCPHHRKCPLQVGKPQYYEFKEGRNLKFCNFQKSIQRPKFSLELKKGRILATPWQSKEEGIGAKGLARSGSGRPNGRDFEILNYSYLIMERSKTDVATIQEIERQRRDNDWDFKVGSLGDRTPSTWPRILNSPLKRKGHVTLDLCAPSGHLEKWTVPRSFSKEVYHDARKASKGDLWGLDAKSKIEGMGNLDVKKFEQIEKDKIKELKKAEKREDRELREAVNAVDYGFDQESPLNSVDLMAALYGAEFDKGKRKKAASIGNGQD